MSQEESFVTHRCPLCEGVSHPASGCVYSANFIVCGPCVRRDWNNDSKRGPIGWLFNHINSKGGRSGLFFYEHVGMSPASYHDRIACVTIRDRTDKV